MTKTHEMDVNVWLMVSQYVLRSRLWKYILNFETCGCYITDQENIENTGIRYLIFNIGHIYNAIIITSPTA